MTDTQRFRKKPVEIDAMLFDGSAESATPIIDWVLDGGHTARYHAEDEGGPGLSAAMIAIDTLEGTMRAMPGDWIIRGVQGEFYPCKPDIFAETYEPA